MPDWLRPGALLTDLYQLTMLQSYFLDGFDGTAVFELFVRRLPRQRSFLVFAGLEQALDYLERLRFEPDELEWLERSGRFRRDFVEWLATLRFTGDVHAMAEGTVFFADEPVLRVVAPLPQAQLVETRLLNLVHLQSLVASKAARVVLAARGKRLVDFGLRRSHGAEAGLLAARAAYLAGFAGTSAVLAGRGFDIPTFGTMAHSFIQCHRDEREAFERFARSQPDDVTLLIDTYDTEAAARQVAELAPRLRAEGAVVRAVRIDSGDLAAHARAVRRILDDAGLADVGIFASGDLDEYAIARILAAASPIDGFGVGTHLATSADAPSLDFVYKLQEYAGRPCRKRSERKATWPGRKQVFRQLDDGGRMLGDLITLEGASARGEPLLRPVLRSGRRIAPLPSLAEARAHAVAELRRLPDAQRSIGRGRRYPVRISRQLRALARVVDRAR